MQANRKETSAWSLVGLLRHRASRSVFCDNGPGVDDQLARHLFDPLATSKEEGLGLGLPICVSIIESHGGRIWLHSRDAGSTEFRFSLPLDQPDRSVAMATPTIFVIDDHEPVRHALGEMLSVFGFTVETYDSADVFLQVIDQSHSGCVVADVRMPGTDGIEFVRELGRRKIALSGRPYFRSRRRADGGGGDQVRSGRLHRETGGRRQLWRRSTGHWRRTPEQQDLGSRRRLWI